MQSEILSSLFYYVLLLSASDYGLFKSDKDSITGCWLNEERTLEYYNLKSGDILQYKSKLRLLRMKTLDDSIKTLKIDESQTVTEVVKAVCVKIGMLQYHNYCILRIHFIMVQVSAIRKNFHLQWMKILLNKC